MLIVERLFEEYIFVGQAVEVFKPAQGEMLMGKATNIDSKKQNNEKKKAKSVDETVDQLAEMFLEMMPETADFKEFEETMLEVGNEVVKRALKKKLQVVSNKYGVDFIYVDGKKFKRHSKGKSHYHSLCGTVKIERYVYRQVGLRNGPTVVPLDIESQIIERSTPALAYRATLGDAQCPGRQWEEQMRADHRHPPSRSTLERLAKRLGSAIREDAANILPEIRKYELPNMDAVSVSIGLDRTTIPMEERLRELRPIAPQKKRKKPYVRKKPPAVEVNYRMAYVGTVSLNGPDGEALQTYRYACSADANPAPVLENMMDDLLHIQQSRWKSRHSELPMGIIQDGAPEMWRLVESAVEKAFPEKQFSKAIDRYHLAERLAESLKSLKDPIVNREVRMREWQKALETNDNAIDKIETFIHKEMNRLKKHNSLSVAKAEILRIHLTYIENNKHLMRYKTLIDKGLPTGSGATEGACKSLIMIRAKGCGQRWHSKGVNAVLTLRSLYQNGRLESFWNHYCEAKHIKIEQAA